MQCTLVTAYYPIPSKFDADKYMRWAAEFMKLDAPIVLFTDAATRDTIAAMRSFGKPLYIVTIEFDRLDAWVAYKDAWIAQHAVDHERHIHTPQLYAIWAMKTHFVRKAIEANPFNTEYFFWCDIGVFRQPMNDFTRTSFPAVKHMREGVIMTAIERMRPGDVGCPRTVRNAGGLWGGKADACMKWIEAQNNMLDAYIRAGKFAGKDQAVMLDAHLENPHIATFVIPTIPDMDPWFFLTRLLSDEPDIPYVKDHSYYMMPACQTNT